MGAGVWNGGIGRGFRKGARQTGFSLGAGFGTHALGSKTQHDLALAIGRTGRMLGPNWQLLTEFFGGMEFDPSHRTVAGLTLLARYHFTTGSRWVPFANLGVGVTYTDIRGGDLSTRFQFNDQLGVGVHRFLREDTAFTLEYRWFHLSNAGIKSPNNGVNTHMFFAGMNWFF